MTMKLLLRREQHAGLLGKISFSLTVRAELTEEEKSSINRYKLGDTVLYEKSKIVDPGSGLLGVASRLAHKAMNVSVSVRDLAGGRRIDCKDVVEMLAIEEQIRVAAHTFRSVLEAARTFGGEEVVEIA
jgi:hypothetical protein